MGQWVWHRTLEVLAGRGAQAKKKTRNNKEDGCSVIFPRGKCINLLHGGTLGRVPGVRTHCTKTEKTKSHHPNGEDHCSRKQEPTTVVPQLHDLPTSNAQTGKQVAKCQAIPGPLFQFVKCDAWLEPGHRTWQVIEARVAGSEWKKSMRCKAWMGHMSWLWAGLVKGTWTREPGWSIKTLAWGPNWFEFAG
jgi:hypothetical protein